MLYGYNYLLNKIEQDSEIRSRLQIARIKNGFNSVDSGYRDVKINLIYTGINGTKMIGECLSTFIITSFKK